MRITKKFARNSSIGKQAFERAHCGDSPANVWAAAWATAAATALSSFFHIRETFFDAVKSRDGISLSMIVPDPFEGLMTVSELYEDAYSRTQRREVANSFIANLQPASHSSQWSGSGGGGGGGGGGRGSGGDGGGDGGGAVSGWGSGRALRRKGNSDVKGGGEGEGSQGVRGGEGEGSQGDVGTGVLGSGSGRGSGSGLGTGSSSGSALRSASAPDLASRGMRSRSYHSRGVPTGSLMPRTARGGSAVVSTVGSSSLPDSGTAAAGSPVYALVNHLMGCHEQSVNSFGSGSIVLAPQTVSTQSLSNTMSPILDVIAPQNPIPPSGLSAHPSACSFRI